MSKQKYRPTESGEIRSEPSQTPTPMSINSQERAKREWKKDDAAITDMYEKGVEAHIASVSNLAGAFQLADRGIRCIDEGTTGGIHIAGQGILLEEDKATAAIAASKANAILSHDGCGAANIAYKGLSDAERDALKKQGIETSDQYGIMRSKEIAQAAGIEYAGHIPAENMVRPADMHNARVVYYDGTGRFDNSKLPAGVPNGFVVSRRYLEKGYALKETDVSAGIATGNHGFGDRITPKTPLLIIPIGDPRNPEFSTERLTKELKESGIVAKYDNRVKIDGFTAPASA